MTRGRQAGPTGQTVLALRNRQRSVAAPRAGFAEATLGYHPDPDGYHIGPDRYLDHVAAVKAAVSILFVVTAAIQPRPLASYFTFLMVGLIL